MQGRVGTSGISIARITLEKNLAGRRGTHCQVQVDFTEARLAVKLDPSGDLLKSFIELNNLALSRFSNEQRHRIAIHICPGGNRDSTRSAEVDCAQLRPSLFTLTDDTSASSETAFEKLGMRIAGTALAGAVLEGRHAR